MSAIYRDTHHAVVRAMAVDAISDVATSWWQSQYKSGYVESLTMRHSDTEKLTKQERITQDCMTRAKIHRASAKASFYAITARYGADDKERAEAVNELVKLVVCDGVNDDFKRLAIWSWASANIKKGMMERLVNICEKSRRTFFRKKKIIVEQLDRFESAVKTDCDVVLSGLVIG